MAGVLLAATSIGELAADIDRQPHRVRAVFGLIQDVDEIEGSAGTSYCVSMDRGKGPPVRIRTWDPRLAARARVGRYVVGVGAWSMYRPTTNPPRRYPYEEAQLWPEIGAQVAIWTPRFSEGPVA